MSVVLETTKGDLTVDLFIKERPKTCLNFLKLCKMKRYNFNRFHHVERNFLCQTGDPTGTGRGGESIFGLLYGQQAKYYEAEQLPVLKHTKPGLLSMVNVGDNMLGSQFFITLGDNLDFLDKEHCVFGEVVEGHDALLNINEAICDENHVPYQDIRITHTVILEDPYPDPPGLEIPVHSPEPTKEMLDSGRIAADEDINDMEGKTAEEIEELIAEKEAKARATILEMVGDLPSVDAAPPENVLFVCKLNPVTTDDDLMIIFSRFGKIVNCEIIRDRQTMNSLQYAFIEFDNPKSCEDAYFKMDNVLIDDRRIHVDFSQSVSRLQWKGKGRGVEFVGGKAFDPNKEDYKVKGQFEREQSKRISSDQHSKRYAPHQRQRDFQQRDKYQGGREHREDRDGRDHREHREDRDGRDRREHREERDGRDRGKHREDRDGRDREDRREHREDRDRPEHREDRDRRDHRDHRTNRSDFDNRGRRGERDNREERRNHDRDHRERRRSPDRSQKQEDVSAQKRIRRNSSPKKSHRASRHGKVTTGSYRVPLPDGRVQVVNYRADWNGYVADIQYEEVAKYPEYKNAASYSASANQATAYIATTLPPVSDILTTTARTNTNVYTTTIRNYHGVPVTTTPAPTTTTSRALNYEAPIYPLFKNPSYTDTGYKAPNFFTRTSIPAGGNNVKHQAEAEYSEPNNESGPTYDRPFTPPFNVPAYIGALNKVADVPTYGLRYLGDLKSIKGSEIKGKVAPAAKAFHRVSEYEIPNATATSYYEAPSRIPVNPGYAVVASPIPLAFRALNPSKSTEDMKFSRNKEYEILENETPVVSPPSDKSKTIAAPAYSAYVTSPENKVVMAATSAYTVPVYPTPTYSESANPKLLSSFSDSKAPTMSVSKFHASATTDLADSALLYSSSAYSEPEHRSTAPIYKASSYFNPNKERVSVGYKELARIFRETSLTAGNKNWDNFFNKAWEFARTKY
uniref:peptidylprolyl isomerase n=1 Tax=Daphnia lumholtzi TaxID=42856 RepID=A0A4Y7MBK7_9CRUS|nr:EOG090X0971 [Daphnia lumholtzi]